MNVVDALCETCGKPIRWLPGQPMVCSRVCAQLLGQRQELSEAAALAEVERILKHA